MTAGLLAIRYVAACQRGILGLPLASRTCAHGSTPHLQRTDLMAGALPTIFGGGRTPDHHGGSGCAPPDHVGGNTPDQVVIADQLANKQAM